MTYKPKILFVDDDSSLNQILTRILTDQGYSVDIAVDGLSALEKLQKTNYDVAILDNNLPQMNAIDVLKKIQHRNIANKVIMITAVNEEELARESRKLGVQEVLSKPFDINQVISSIHKVCKIV